MGGLVGGIFDLLGGDPAAKEEKEFSDLSGYETNLGEKSTSEGLGFESDILSGDPAKIAEALSPEIKAGQEQVTQQALGNAAFGNRGGGTNASTQAAQSGERGNIINLIGAEQQEAAQALTGAGENLLGQGSTNIGNEANLAIQNRQRQVGDVSGIASDVASIATGFADPGTGTDPYQTLYNAKNPDRTGIETISPGLSDISIQ